MNSNQAEFYKIIAQIIPILFLAISIQSTFLVHGVKYVRTETFIRNVHIMVFIVMVLLLTMGEIVSLRGVYLNKTFSNDIFIITLTLTSAVIWITTEYILYLLRKIKEIYLVGFLLIGLLLNIIFTYILI